MITKSASDWRAELTPEQYRICREKGTEPPFSGEYYHCQQPGIYHCLCCGEALFDARHKYDSGSGWPSFWQPVNPEAVAEHNDSSHGMKRVEITCRHCDAHLGHVFEDGPKPTGLRYCINSTALKLESE